MTGKEFYMEPNVSKLIVPEYCDKEENLYTSLYKFPRMGNYFYTSRFLDGRNLTYFKKVIDNLNFVGKYLSYSNPSYVQLCGLPSIEGVISKESINNMLDTVNNMLNKPYIKIILSEYEIKLLSRVTTDFQCTYRDSEYYDNIETVLSKYDEPKYMRKKIRPILNNSDVVIRKLTDKDTYAVLDLIEDFKNEKGKDYHRGKMYESLAYCFNEIGYTIVGLFYKGELLSANGYKSVGAVVRSDFIVNKRNPNNVPSSIHGYAKHALRYIIYKELKELNFNIYCVDGATSEKLRQHKRNMYTDEIKRYLIWRNNGK